ncbi:MAG: hypothetical protein Q9163_002524 [Psora crenata]
MNAKGYGVDLSLTADEEGLLRTALSSNPRVSPQDGSDGNLYQESHLNVSMAQGPNLHPPPVKEPSHSDHFTNMDDSSLFENYDLEDGNYEWDINGDHSFADPPGNDDNDIHDKRKASTTSDDGETLTSKRQEGDGKTAKKPGRKPLTAEPTTKRKAQNRAAQRAFRERKERHLKDLETKVDDLEKASEATNHENGRLRAQVEKLNMELKEYRKRLSLNSTVAGHSPPSAAPQGRARHSGSGNDIQFAFPKFGDLPGASFLNNGSLAKTSTPQHVAQRPSAYPSHPGVVRNNSSNSAHAISPTTTDGSLNQPLSENMPYQDSDIGLSTVNNEKFDGLTSLFSPSLLETASRSNSGDYISGTGFHSTASSVKQGSSSSNSAPVQPPKARYASSASMTDSPSSSMSHAGLNSSCGTTPEPSGDSPDIRKSSEVALKTINEEMAGQNNTGGKEQLHYALPTACGNTVNPISPILSGSNSAPVYSTVLKPPISGVNGIDWMAQQNGGQFDPVLFGSYRHPQDNILNHTFDDLFNDAYEPQDFASPYNTGDAIASAKKDSKKEIEDRQENGNGEVVTAEKPKQFFGYDQLWETIHSSEKFKCGELDVDDLCSEFKSKARCTGKGVMIDDEEVDRIFGPAVKNEDDMFKMFS